MDEQEDKNIHKKKQGVVDKDYKEFLDDIEEDPELRSNI
jgi:hypothetical protein